MKKGIVLGILLACWAQFGWAEMTTETVDDVVVTATRTSGNLELVGGTSVTVITAEEIEASHLTTVAEILQTVPGLQMSNAGGMGAASKVFIRGADSKNTLLLIDGIVANDPTDVNRGADFSNILLDNVERIEVVKGAMSVLYGSNATAGVINIITRSGSQGVHGYAGVEAGTYNTKKFSGGLNGSVGEHDFSLAISRLTSQGYSLANADNNAIPHAGNTSEDDAWENTTFSGKFTAQLCPAASLTGVIRYTAAEMELDDWGSGYAGDRFDYDFMTYASTANPTGEKENSLETRRLFTRINLHTLMFDGKVVSDLDYKFSRQERDAYDNDDNDSYDYLGKTDELSWQATWQMVEANRLTVGVGYFNEDAEGAYFEAQDAEIISLWLQDQYTLGGLDLIVGLRHDEHDRFGGKTTWRIAPAYQIRATGTTLRASYATGFRAPSLYELYSYYGNEELDPEKSRSFELGVDQVLLNDQLMLGVTWFKTRFEDRIDFVYPGGYVQLNGESKTQGVEVGVTLFAKQPLSCRVDYTYLDTQDPDGARMERRPLNKVHAGLRYNQGAFGCNIDGYWVDEREAVSSAIDENGTAVTSLDDYFLVNLAADYEVNDFLTLYGRVDNLFDEHYEEAWSYATAGQSFYLGGKVHF
jgi:vitamin B12 transporter